ncbi:MAG: porin family protein [Flavobacteriaceae bacterium]
MKTTQSILVLLCLMCFTPLFAQFTFGVKGGVNYDTLGTLEPTDLTLENFQADAQTGFHFGVFGNFDLLTFYVRPELHFSQSVSQFDQNKNISLNKLEAPVLLGYKILGPLSVFAGPSFQYIISEKGKDITLGELKENFTVGLQLGTRVKLGRFGVGIRFERGFTENEVIILGNNNVDIAGRVDTRPKQWILSASYDLK